VYDEIAILCNILSMAHLQKEDFKLCQDLLKKAELFTENNDRLRAITFNNYACLFRKTNKLRNALSYLEQALDLEYTCLNSAELSVDDSLKISNPCEIHLNICAILSQMGKHELALHHAMKALLLIQDELLARTETSSPGSAPSQADAGNDDRFTVMVIALHNIAVEHEYLKQFQQSLTHYKKAKDFAQSSLGSDHIMSKKMDLVF
jgi:tetratricopeptide (TPR) repeat protein